MKRAKKRRTGGKAAGATLLLAVACDFPSYRYDAPVDGALADAGDEDAALLVDAGDAATADARRTLTCAGRTASFCDSFDEAPFLEARWGNRLAGGATLRLASDADAGDGGPFLAPPSLPNALHLRWAGSSAEAPRYHVLTYEVPGAPSQIDVRLSFRLRDMAVFGNDYYRILSFRKGEQRASLAFRVPYDSGNPALSLLCEVADAGPSKLAVFSASHLVWKHVDVRMTASEISIIEVGDSQRHVLPGSCLGDLGGVTLELGVRMGAEAAAGDVWFDDVFVDLT